MANTFRLNWFRKLINSCSSTRKYRHIDDSHPIASTSDLKSLGPSHRVPRLPEKTNSATVRPAKCHKRPNIAMTVRMHSVVRNLNSSNKQLRNLTLDLQKRGRNEQLAKTLKSRASGTPSRPISVEIFVEQRQAQTQPSSYQRIGYQDERDLVVTRNIEKMVREWQVRLQSRRRSKKEQAAKGRKSSGMPVKFTKQNNPKTGSLGLEHITSQGKHINKDVKLARSSVSSRTTDDPNHRNKQARQTYKMNIVHLKVKNIRDQRKSLNKDNKTVPITKTKTKTKSITITNSKSKSKSKSKSSSKSKSKPPNPPASCNLIKEEQKRLDILKAEWVQLKGLENASRLKEDKELAKPKVPETAAPTDLDLASLIVDPKSFLTKVHVKSQFLSVDLGDNKTKSPDVYPDTSKGNKNGFGGSDDGLPELGPD